MSSIETMIPKNKSEHVAQLLLERIISANLEPGSSFGTEADLLQQFSVSRPTLRESLRILEAQGVLELRPGPKGGIIVTKPGIDVLAHALSVYLRLHGVPFITVLKAREAIEPALAAEAASARTEDDLVRLQDSVDRLKEATTETEFLKENRRFHSLVAEAGQNEVLMVFWSTISTLASGELHGITYTATHQHHVAAAHQAIVDAIRLRDEALASQRMGAHVQELQHLVHKRYQHLLSQTTDVIPRQGRRVD